MYTTPPSFNATSQIAMSKQISNLSDIATSWFWKKMTFIEKTLITHKGTTV